MFTEAIPTPVHVPTKSTIDRSAGVAATVTASVETHLHVSKSQAKIASVTTVEANVESLTKTTKLPAIEKLRLEATNMPTTQQPNRSRFTTEPTRKSVPTPTVTANTTASKTIITPNVTSQTSSTGATTQCTKVSQLTAPVQRTPK